MEQYPAFSLNGDLWVASGDTDSFNKNDYRQALDSMSDWIDTLPDYVGFLSERDLAGEPADVEVLGDGAMTRIEKTIQLCAHCRKVISLDFIHRVQEWLNQGRQHWRVIISTGNNEWLTTYPALHRVGEHINPSVADLERLAAEMKAEDPGLS